ncbi:RNA polymerase sigma factor [Peribacillus simplex]|uniref:RNA polymerase sigma factor n=1 Tax=Peribacillus TaxID=2675229 RepID=UPI0038210777
MKDFKEFYRLYSKELYNYLFYLTNDRTLAEELVQETFYQAFKSIHRFKGDSKIKTWLYQIGKNVYYKYLKMNSPNNDVFDENDGNFANISTPENILQKEEQDRALHQAIQQLKEPYKQVVILRSFNELSFKDIGEVFLESENWARVTFHRGKHKLRTILKRGNDLENQL